MFGPFYAFEVMGEQIINIWGKILAIEHKKLIVQNFKKLIEDVNKNLIKQHNKYQTFRIKKIQKYHRLK